MSYMDKVMQSESAKNWVMIPGKDDNDPLYFCKTTGQVFDKNGISPSSQFPQAESDSDESDGIQKGSFEDFLRKFAISETESDSIDGTEGAFGHYLRQFFIPNLKPKLQSWTELATSYASKQLSGSWESDSEEEIESKESQQISKPMQTAKLVSSSPSNGPCL